MYQHNKVNRWTADIVDHVLTELTKLGKPFKYIVQAVIMQKNGAGLHTASSCYCSLFLYYILFCLLLNFFPYLLHFPPTSYLLLTLSEFMRFFICYFVLFLLYLFFVLFLVFSPTTANKLTKPKQRKTKTHG